MPAMLTLNLCPRVKVVHPYSHPGLGRQVLGSRDLVRKRLLAQSLRAVRLFLETNAPQLVTATSDQSEMSDQGQFQRLDDFEPTKYNLNPDVNEKLDFLNHFCREVKIKGRYVEFVLDGLPGIPRSLVRIVPRSKPLNPKSEKYLRDSAPFYVFLMMVETIKKGIYTESRLHRLFCRELGQVSRQTMKYFLGSGRDRTFRRLLRPARLENAEPLYFVYGTGNTVFSRKIAPVALPGGEYFTLIFRSEADELVAEGRVVPVFLGRKLPCYFTPEALKERLELGQVLEIRAGEETKYVDASLRHKYLKADARLDIKLPSAAQVLLKYIREMRLSTNDRRAYPMLAMAIDLLQASPAGADQYLEAGRIAAEYGACEDNLVALLLRKDLRLGVKEDKRFLLGDVDSHSWEVIRETGPGSSNYSSKCHRMIMMPLRIEDLLNKNVSKVTIGSAKELLDFLKDFAAGLDKSKVRLEYFAAVLGRLRYTRVGGLEPGEVRHLRAIVAPLVEKYGYADLAAMIRNEIFRIHYNRQYLRTKRSIEKAAAMNYQELNLHLQDMAGLLRQALAAEGLELTDSDIQTRVKLPFSVWEKMQSSGMKRAGHVYDILGVNLVLGSEPDIRLALGLIEQVFPSIARGNFNDRQGLVSYMERSGTPDYKNNIARPRKSGFSAITLRRLTTLGLPIEIQLTTPERHKLNTGGLAAHWKHKMRREIRTFFGFDVKEIGID
jgi:hypothetical protein